MLATARLILAIVCGSYLLSAAILGVARLRGQPVPAWVILAWLVTGLLGFALLPALRPGRPLVLASIGVVLLPWMAYSLVGDLRGKHWLVAVTDVAGLAAIAYSLWLAR